MRISGAHDICFSDPHTLFVSQVIGPDTPSGGIARCVDDVVFDYYTDKCSYYGISWLENGLVVRDGPMNKIELISKEKVKIAEWQLPAGKHKGLDTTSQGYILICDSLGDCIRVYEASGQLIRVIKNSHTRKPQYIAASPEDDSFVFTCLHSESPAVTKMSLSGDVIWEYDDMEFPQGVAVDSNGDVYVCDSGNNKIIMITSDGLTTFNMVDRRHLDNKKPFAIALCEDMMAVQLMDEPVVKLFQLT